MPLPHVPAPDNDSRPTNTFAVEDRDGDNTVCIYFRQHGDGQRTVRIIYRLENAVKRYDDVGKFFWNLTGETGISDIGTLTATVTAPEGVPAEDFHIWAHGPDNGSFDKQADGSAVLRVDNVALGTVVDIRVISPADWFHGGWAQEGTALGRILAEEKELADRANARGEEEAREKEEQERLQADSEAYWSAYWAERNTWAEAHPVQKALQDSCSEVYLAFQYKIINELPNMLLIAGFAIFLIAIIWGMGQRNPKKFRFTPAQSPQYCRALPDDRPPPVVALLVHFYDGSPNACRQISATLLELNMQGLIRFRTLDDDVELVLDARQGEKLFPPSSNAHTQDDQEALWSFLVNATGDHGRVAMKDLQQYIRDHQEAAWNFRSSFISAVNTEYQKRRDGDGQAPPSLVEPGFAGFCRRWRAFLQRWFACSARCTMICIGVITFVLLALMIFVFCLGRRFDRGRCVILNQMAENDLALWQAYGRYLDDFTNMEDKDSRIFPSGRSPWSTPWRWAMAPRWPMRCV